MGTRHGAEEFTDKSGNPISPWRTVVGLIWATAKTKAEDGVELGQFPQSSLTNFHDSIRQLARIVAGLCGLPPHYLGIVTAPRPRLR